MLTKSLEDYLEAIKILTNNKKVTRVKDIGELLKVKSSSVVNAMNSLKEKGYIKQEKYGYIELTETGRKAALKIFKKHRIILKFLIEVLRVPKEIAEMDACKIEHVISEETFNKILEFYNYYNENQSNNFSKKRGRANREE